MVDFKRSFAKAHEKGISEAASAHLDAVRGFAALTVLISHARHLLLLDWGELKHRNFLIKLVYGSTEFGHQAVIIFFVLSGFLIGPGVLRSIHARRWSSARYFVHRFLRLEIVLAPALLLCLFWDVTGTHLFGLAGIYGGKTGIYPVGYDIQSRITAPVFFGNIAFVQTLLVPTFGSDSPLWSLANEFWYYLLFPCVALALIPRSRAITRILYGTVAILIAWFTREDILLYFLIWVFGAALFYLPKLNCSLRIRRAMLAVSAALFFLDVLSTKREWQNAVLSDFVLSGCFLFFLYCLLIQSTPVSTRYSKFSHGLASSSYTLYVVHVPFLVFISVWIGTRWVPTTLHLALAMAVLCGTWLYAYLVYRVFEAHTREVRVWTEKKLKLL